MRNEEGISATRTFEAAPFIATAAWSIPQTVSSRVPEKGSGLECYAAVFDGVKINTTFYRCHLEEDVRVLGKRGAGAFPFRGEDPARNHA